MNLKIQEENGFALILTLMVTAILAVIVLEFAQTTKIDMEIARNYKDHLESYAIARSGIEFAIYALKADDPDVDDLTEDWAKDYSKILSSVMFKNGSLKLNITDESSKININSVILHGGTSKEKVWDTTVNNLKRLCEITNQDYKFVDAAIDWIDKNDEVTIFEGQKESGGAEDRDYESLTPPYKCKNAQLDTLRELFLIKGFTEETYFGTKEEKGSESESFIKRTGLKDFITIYGSHRININTAPNEVIMSLDLDLTQDMALEIIKEREKSPFRSSEDLKKIQIIPEKVINNISKKIIFKSTGFFSLKSYGIVNNIATEINAVLYRASKVQIFVVYWQVI
ncbi:MAG: general secretion pathway protein GspK [Candidatus Firestonebacteria bacterium]|nr:general secretion pathway protein GspK [Candidatus Firestonebacteria bacterium]